MSTLKGLKLGIRHVLGGTDIGKSTMVKLSCFMGPSTKDIAWAAYGAVQVKSSKK